uniref:zinc finger protein 280B isoform X3 n=1 Tax=Ictidomys tridecemlineatus TaxID=43179 RepID=UPI001A9F384B|nr:zinc finger protein 280B isoform X3 [Ictidomys tridecemlineatus]XP_040147998.1 zinc finger protein 280B isoform X3 [Ictidomys tridecemlineatus]
MEQPCVLCEEEQDPEPQNIKETKQIDDEDAELIFVGVEHVNEDAELIFVGVSSNSKPVVSNILNRVTPGSCSRRKKYGCRRKDTVRRLQPISHVTPSSETVTMLPVSQSESRSTDSPIIIEPLSKPDDKSNSPKVVPSSSSESCSPVVTLTSSLHHPVKAALSEGDEEELLKEEAKTRPSKEVFHTAEWSLLWMALVHGFMLSLEEISYVLSLREAPAPLIPKIADHSPLMSWNRKLQHKQEPGSFLTASSLFKDVNLNLRFCYDPPPGPPQELEEHRMD